MMNKRNMERGINNWELCPSKSFPGKFYYFNMVTGEAAWSLAEIENARSMPKNSYIQKVNKWHTYPEPDSPPDDRFFEPTWRRKPQQYVFGRPTVPRFGQPALPMYGPQYMEPRMPVLMQNSAPMGSVCFGDMRRQKDVQNMWGYDREPCFPPTEKTKMFLQCEKPQGNLFNTNFNTSTPMKSQWSSYDYQNNGAIPVFGQSRPKIPPRMIEPVFAQKQANQAPALNKKNPFLLQEKPKTVIKEPMFSRRTVSESTTALDCDKNVFKTKSIENLRSHDDTALFERPQNTNVIQRSPVFQSGRIFGTKSRENVSTFNNSGRFEMPKPKNVFLNLQDKNIRFSKQISKSNENVSSTGDLRSNLSRKTAESLLSDRNTALKQISKSSKNVSSTDNVKSITSIKRAHSVLTGQDKDVEKRKIDRGKDKGEQDALNELGETDLRHILVAKRKKIENPGGGTGTKVKTRYSETNKVQTPKKRVTFDVDFQSKEEVSPQENLQEDLEMYGDEADNEKPPLDIKSLKNKAKPHIKTDAWYIVVDLEVLLQDFEFIETFVQSDSKCRLLIPIAVRLQLDALCVGDCRGRTRVMAARHVARRVNDLPQHITVQVAEEFDPDTSTRQSIINCCSQTIEQKYHVVLITNDADIYKNATLNDIPCYTLDEIKEGASTPKPELSFDIRKIVHPDKDTVSRSKNQNIIVSSSANPFSLDSRSKVPVNCFRQRLFDDQNTENNHDDALFFDDDDRNIIDDPFLIPNTNQMLKGSEDCKNFHQSNFIPPKDYRDNKDISDSSANTSEVRQIQENIQNLVIKDTSRNIKVHMEGMVSKPENFHVKPKFTEENLKFFQKDEAMTTERTTKKIIPKSINGYTIEQHLKQFDIKNKMVEERVKTRMDEWICSYSQIMEDILTYILQDYATTQSTLRPPWSLPEAVQCVRDMYGDHSSVRTIVDRLAELLFNCSCKKGKLKLDMKPKDFMTIFGLGILLIQCLKNMPPSSCAIAAAEEALLSLLQLVTDPAAEPEPPAAAPAPPLCTASTDTNDRKNFVKKPSDVIEYLRKHYPEWKSYKETTKEEDLHRKMDQLKEKSKQMQKIVRTFGKDLRNLKIDNHKVLSMTKANDKKTSAKKDKHSNSKEIKAKNVKVTDDNVDDIETASACDKAIRTTGAKLLRKLAVNSLHKPPTLKNIDVKKRDQTGVELNNMIENMVGNSNTDVVEAKVAENNDGNNNADHVVNENHAIADKEPKFVRKFGNFTIKKINFQSDGDNIKNTLVNEAPKETNETKRERQKIIRSYNQPNSIKDKKEKTEEKLDLDALDYEMDIDDKRDTSQIAIVDSNDDENHDDAGNQNDDDNKQTDDESPKNDQRSGDDRNNENVETDTTNDSGFENDGLHAYALVRTCLTEISGTFMAIYSFMSSAEVKFREGCSEGAKRELHRRAGETRGLLLNLIGSLKSIIKRESNAETSMRTIIMKSGVEALNDKRIIQYRQVVSKLLEQAYILHEGLATILAATGAAADDGTLSSLSSTIKYINIFE